MKTRNTHLPLLLAGSLNLFSAFLHLIAGQAGLVVPLWESQMELATQAQWLGAWHMVTVLLFGTSWILLRRAFQKQRHAQELQWIGWGYILFGLCFIGSSLFMDAMAPQWVLLAPIGIMTLWGTRNRILQERVEETVSIK